MPSSGYPATLRTPLVVPNGMSPTVTSRLTMCEPLSRAFQLTLRRSSTVASSESSAPVLRTLAMLIV